jgi:nucleoside-diphosphate-sugar epimerase
MKVLVTGANGFVGSAVCSALADRQHQVAAVSRESTALDLLSFSEHSAQYLCRIEADFGNISSIQEHLQGVQAIVHCAARVHQVRETAADPLTEYRRVNTQATLALAQSAAQAGVKRFVFLSSVKVNGNFSPPGQPYRADQASPEDSYGISKWEAELGLMEIAAKTGMEVVIIRPPLVYGSGVKANFLTMMQWLHKGVPLPLGAISNQRSLVALPNLVDFIALCLTHPRAANLTFMISDQHDVSTTDLLRGLGEALGRPARLLPMPQKMLQISLQVIGKGAVAQRLLGDLAVDTSAATQLLDWKPPLTVQQGLQLAATHFLGHLPKP